MLMHEKTCMIPILSLFANNQLKCNLPLSNEKFLHCFERLKKSYSEYENTLGTTLKNEIHLQ